MKNSILFILLVAITIGCKPEANPEDLAGKKSLLSSKKSELKTLENEIKGIEDEIALLEPPKIKTALVTLDTIKKETLERYAELQGSVMSQELVNASSEIGGRLIKVNVKEGDIVRKGQLIAVVDTEILSKQEQELRTRMSLASSIYEKQKKLWEQNIGSEIQFLQAKNNIESLQKSLETLQFQLTKKNVYAPVNGSVDMEYLKSGEIASPGMPIVSILNTNKLVVTADVPENYLTKVKRGDKVQITFPALDKEISRNITLVGRSIDPSNRTFKIEMNTDNMNGLLKPNLLASVKIKDLTIKDAIGVSTDLIQEEVDGTQYVYVALPGDEYMTAKKKFVKTGEVSNGIIEIIEGLSVGDMIVVNGARTIVEGDNIINDNSN